MSPSFTTHDMRYGGLSDSVFCRDLSLREVYDFFSDIGYQFRIQFSISVGSPMSHSFTFNRILNIFLLGTLDNMSWIKTCWGVAGMTAFWKRPSPVDNKESKSVSTNQLWRNPEFPVPVAVFREWPDKAFIRVVGSDSVTQPQLFGGHSGRSGINTFRHLRSFIAMV